TTACLTASAQSTQSQVRHRDSLRRAEAQEIELSRVPRLRFAQEAEQFEQVEDESQLQPQPELSRPKLPTAPHSRGRTLRLHFSKLKQDSHDRFPAALILRTMKHRW